MSRFLQLSLGFALLVGVWATDARADTFTFSFTNTIGTVSGTVTGHIDGLFEGTGAATGVFIDTFPVGLASIETAPINAMLWDQQYENSFTVTGGVITSGGFWAQNTVGGLAYGEQLYVNGGSGPFNFVNLDGTDSLFVYGDSGIAASNFAAAVPEPATVSLVALAGLAGAVATRRRRLAPAPRA